MYNNPMNLPADASNDQSNCPPDYYRRSNGMLHQISDSPPTNTPPSAIDLTSLDHMSREDLIALVARYMRQCGDAPCMSKEETAQAMRDVLAETALRPVVAGLNMKADIQSRMTAIDKWLDRSEGKAAQVQTVTMNVQGSIDHKVMLPATRAFLDSFIEHADTIDG